MHEILTAAFVLTAALTGGVFFAFSVFVMRALAGLPASEGVRAMQRINVVVINPWFLGPFFGAMVFGAAAAALGGGSMMLAATAVYAVGTVGVTIAGNVPLNNALAARDPQDPSTHEYWRTYVRRWLWFNHARTLAAMVSAGVALRTLI